MSNISEKNRIVIKLGTSTLTHKTGKLNIRRMNNLVKVIADLHNSGKEIIIVSSGAVGLGVSKLGLVERPTDTPTKQAAAAVGQCELMYMYDGLFSDYNVTVAQILLTKTLIGDERKKNVENTFERLLSLGVIPIVNENDTVAIDELELEIGENDSLSAIVATIAKAELLIVLSDIDGYIFSGTAGPNIATAIGKALARGQMLFMGKKHPGTLLQNMAFKLYNKPFFPNRTPFDWLSRDENAVDRYIADEKCGFVFTVSGFYDLFSLLQTVSLPHWATRFDRTKPYLLLSGLMDPVGSMGKGVQKVYDRMREAKIENLSLLLYPHGRHEMLNEVSKTEVYEDIYAFIKKNILGAGHEN